MFEYSVRSPESPTLTTRRVATAAGEMDVFAADDLRQALRRQVRGGARRIEVDLTAVTWVNGSALRHLAATWALLEELGAAVHVVGCSPAIARISAVAKLDVAATPVAA